MRSLRMGGCVLLVRRIYVGAYAEYIPQTFLTVTPAKLYASRRPAPLLVVTSVKYLAMVARLLGYF